MTWRTDTGAGRSAFRMLVGEEMVKASSEAQLLGISGATTHFSAIRKAGAKAGALAAVLFVWLVLGGGLILTVVTHLLG